MRPLSRVLCAALAAVGFAATARAGDAPPNVVPLTVGTPRHGYNRLLIAVTICAPAGAPCVRVPDVMVDTGAVGLRIEADALPADFVLPAVRAADGGAVGECMRYVHDSAWGAVVRADVRIGGLLAADTPIQIIDDVALAHPTQCPATGPDPTSNGTLGLGPAATDCAGACEQSVDAPLYFTCEAVCAPIAGRVPANIRLPNPVALFAQNGEGVVFDLPSAPPEGAQRVNGTLTFGVTAADLSGLAAVQLDRSGRFTAEFEGEEFPRGLLDSGTPSFVLDSHVLPRCGDFYCAVPDATDTVRMFGAGGRTVSATVRIGDSSALLARQIGASDAIASSGEGAFVLGAPFFLGRRVALSFGLAAGPPEGGPFFAFGPVRGP